MVVTFTECGVFAEPAGRCRVNQVGKTGESKYKQRKQQRRLWESGLIRLKQKKGQVWVARSE